MSKFPKPSFSHEQMLQQLTDRGLMLTTDCNEERALRYLKLDGYYRLSGYFWEFYDKSCSFEPTHYFEAGTTWDDVLHLYHADKDLRCLLNQALAEIEISIRAILVDTVCEAIKKKTGKNEPFWCFNYKYYIKEFLNPDIPSNNRGFLDLYSILFSTSDKSSVFLKNYKKKYPDNKYPYVWMLIQELSFGNVTTIANNIEPEYLTDFYKSLGFQVEVEEDKNNQKNTILPHTKMKAVLTSLNKLRNLCAHQHRIWNQAFRELSKNKGLLEHYNAKASIISNKADTLANMYIVILHMLTALHPSKSVEFQQDFGEWLHQLCNSPERTHRFLPKMGFSPSILTEYFPKKRQTTDSLA